MTEPRRALVRRITGPFSARRIVVGVALIWLITGAMFYFSRRWVWLLSTGTSLLTVLFLFLLLTNHNRQVKTLSEKLKQLHAYLRTDKERVLRRLRTKHRNGEDS